MRKLVLTLIAISATASLAKAQYVYPNEPAVRNNLEEWQDLKFGLFMHWGTYSQWGVTESWTLEPNDKGWAERPKGTTYEQYVKDYEALQTTFNPVKFDPQQWVEDAVEAGMKYVVFTTKHHDGFNMFDTKQTDYKITSAKCPFHTNPNADVTKAIFNTFRERGFKIGAYYSVQDWNNDDFWWRYFPPKDPTMNYDVNKYPERFERFEKFTSAQLKELAGNYGRVDLFWFDGGGVPLNKKERTADIRALQPHCMVVFRGSGDEYENYTTPEAKVPEKAIDHPWETCMPMGGWSYRPNPSLRTSREYVQMLLNIVSRGGNLLLNVGPSPEGEWHPEIKKRLKDIGAWMKVNSEAIYGTRKIAPYEETKKVFTQKDGYVYAAYMADEDETAPPAEIFIESLYPQPGSKVYLLGYNYPLTWSRNGKGFKAVIPASVRKNPPCKHAYVLKFENGTFFGAPYIKSTLDKVVSWQLAHPKPYERDWTHGAFLAGVVAAYNTTGTKSVHDALIAWGDRNGWQPGSQWYNADDIAICQSYIDIYRMDKRDGMLKPSLDTITKFITTPYPDIKWKNAVIRWWWCDALFMGPPALVKLGMTLGKDEYLQKSDEYFQECYDLLFDKEEHLFARDLNYVIKNDGNDKYEANGKKIFWGRGNGWVMGGLARILKELPVNYPKRKFYENLFKEMAARIASLQQSDGLWRTSLLDPYSYPGGEVSGSGFYCFALAYGINSGLLDRKTYLPVVRRAWTGLNNCLNEEGRLGWCQPVGAAPGRDINQDSWEVFGTGAFLLAGSEVFRIEN